MNELSIKAENYLAEFNNILENHFPGMFVVTNVDYSTGIEIFIDDEYMIKSNCSYRITQHILMFKLEQTFHPTVFFCPNPESEEDYNLITRYNDGYLTMLCDRDFWKESYNILIKLFKELNPLKNITRTCGYVSKPITSSHTVKITYRRSI